MPPPTPRTSHLRHYSTAVWDPFVLLPVSLYRIGPVEKNNTPQPPFILG